MNDRLKYLQEKHQELLNAAHDSETCDDEGIRNSCWGQLYEWEDSDEGRELKRMESSYTEIKFGELEIREDT